MKKLNNIFIILLVISGLFLNSCNEFLDLQEDPDVPGTDEITEEVVFPAVCAKWLQVLSETTSQPLYWNLQKSVYSSSPIGGVVGQIETEGSGTYFAAYNTIIFQAKNLKKIAVANGNTNYQGIAELLEAYGWATITDFFGEAPFTEAFQFPDIYHPKYDDQEVIYEGIEKLIDDAITHLSDNSSKAVIGTDDFIYGGDEAKWLKLAYSLKARYAMRLSYAPGKTKSAQADIVLAALAKGLSSNSDDATMVHYEGTGERGWVYQEQYSMDKGYYATNQIVDQLQSTNDPRLPIYLSKDYLGGYSGLVIGNLHAVSEYPSFVSRVNYIYPSMPSVFMTYAECKFLEAEAYVFKGNFAAAKTAFEGAVNADIKSLKVAVSQQDINTFLAQFDFANNEETAQKIIITQKHLANFYETPECHFDKIRTGYPIYDYAGNYNLSGTIAVPRKLPFPVAEINMNDNVPDFVGSAQTNRMWWDAKTLTDEMR